MLALCTYAAALTLPRAPTPAVQGNLVGAVALWSTAALTPRTSLQMAARGRPLPRAVVFDLDGCLWYPDM